MKKIILSLFALLLISGVSYSQFNCKNTYNYTGVFPTAMPIAYEGVSYNQEIDFTFPVDTTVNSFTVHIDSLKITSIKGFPNNQFTFNCNVANCVYIPGSATLYQGCFMIAGTPTIGSAGTYKLKVTLEGYISTPFGTQTYAVEDSNVTLTVNACNINANVSATGDTSFCKGDSVKLSASGANKFQWYKDGTLMMNDTLDNILVKDSGDYYVIVTDSATGCFDTSVIKHIIVWPYPTKPIITSKNNILSTDSTGNFYQWSKDGNAISGETKHYTTPTTNGKYQVRVTNAGGCSTISDEFTFQFGAVVESGLIHSFNVFPNPISGKELNIQFSMLVSNPVNIQVCDLNGKVLYNNKVQSQSGKNIIPLTLPELNKGLYIIKLQSVVGNHSHMLTVE